VRGGAFAYIINKYIFAPTHTHGGIEDDGERFRRVKEKNIIKSERLLLSADYYI